MEAYGPATYGDRIADVYDERYGGRDPAAAVAQLAELAGTGPILELGVGTGRVAIPLAQRLAATGVAVHGMDSSEAMLGQLRARPGGDAVTSVVGDMRTADAPGDGYSLVYVVFNTIFLLPDQDAQVECFAAVARRLAPGGRFVIEAFVPDLEPYDHGSKTSVVNVGVEAVDLDAFTHDPVAQRVEGHHVLIRPDGNRLLPISLRYAYPSELDLMARLAGLTLESRSGGFAGEPFTAAASQHVSVYRKPAT